jgi:hypothetical protein
MQRSCADVNSPYRRKCWTNSGGPLQYTVKKILSIFLSPAGKSLTKLSLDGNNLIIPGQGEFGKWHPGWGRDNRWPFLQCIVNSLLYGFDSLVSARRVMKGLPSCASLRAECGSYRGCWVGVALVAGTCWPAPPSTPPYPSTGTG